MPLNSEARSVLALMDEVGAPPLDSLPPDEARAARRELAPPVIDPCHSVEDLDAGGVPARLYRPRPLDDEPTGLVVYFHGGGFVLGDLESHDALCQALCAHSGHAVLSVEYRLAPEHPFPAGLDDCVSVTQWASSHATALRVDAARLAVGGDSAGANFAAVVAHEVAVPLRLQLLIYPVTDARMNTASYDENAEGYFLTASSMAWFIDHYLSDGAGRRDDPRVSPLLAPDEALRSGPPAMVITAGFDPLRDEGVAYADRLTVVGVRTSHVHFPGQIHGFVSLAHLLGDGRSAVRIAAGALAEAFG